MKTDLLRMIAGCDEDEDFARAITSAADEIDRLNAEVEQLRTANQGPAIHRANCPNCQHDDPGMNDTWIEDGKAYQAMYCDSCGADWTERFSLKFEGIQDLSTEDE